MWAYFAHFDMPDDDPDALLKRLRVEYPIRVDRAIGLGTAPTVRLQRALGREGKIGPLEYGLRRCTGPGSWCRTARSPTSCSATASTTSGRR